VTLVATFVNKAVEDFYGYTVEEWLGKPMLWQETIYPDDKGRVLQAFKEAYLLGRDSVVEYRITRKDGELRWVNDRFSWEKDADGRVVGLNGIMSDITKHKKMEQEINKRVKELEEFYQMAVGRELRMAELKREIEKLQKELSKYRKG